MSARRVAGVRRASASTRHKRSWWNRLPGPAQLPIIGSILFAILYGILRPAYDYFYAPLGLTTEEMGLSEISIVGHTAGDAAALLVLMLSLFIFGLLGFRLGRASSI